MLFGQNEVRLYGQVTDANNQPVDSASVWLKQNIDSLSIKDKEGIFKNSYETFTDKNGMFSIDVKPGTYYCLYAIKEVDYGKTKLEYWAWNLPIYKDLEINPKYDRIEIYGINAFEPQSGPFNSYMIYFRPMSLTKTLSLPKEITADTLNIAPANISAEELDIKVNGLTAKIVTIDKIREYTRSEKHMFAYVVQILKPKDNQQVSNPSELVDGFDKISIELQSKETNELGKGVYFVKKIGN
ncbi:carboxypeptidase-like regulatory domain-containing protein [Labilibacter marinus]|uniref:carboxypeptidase-like regulatory domain-containing protein n=1 Tax=Labilibacter marinus TaxID=1477105 RepID=UPI001301348B|nr:carboxypeptidase-like regulatory domain-containing protein [Labilibacter marinus]